MSDFDIPIPYRNRRDPLNMEAYDAAGSALEGDDRAVAEHILYEALTDPALQTVGDLIDRIESASPEERRRLADEAREACGLLTVSEMEKNREIARASRDDPPVLRQGPPREGGKAIQQCASAGCRSLSKDPVTGAVGPVAAKKWWCPRHEGEAAPGDLDDWVAPPVRFAPGGGFAMDPEVEEHERRYYEELVRKSREKARLRQEQNKRELERIQQLQELRAEQAPPLNLGGILVDGRGRVIND